ARRGRGARGSGGPPVEREIHGRARDVHRRRDPPGGPGTLVASGIQHRGDPVTKLGKSDTVRFGIIGCGRIAQTHLQALTTLPEAKLTAAVENRAAAGEAVAAEHKCKLFGDYRETAIADLVDAVIIC